MVVLSREGTRPVTKSREMWDQDRPGTSKGCSRSDGGCLVTLLLAQVDQAVTYSLVSFSREGHQK